MAALFLAAGLCLLSPCALADTIVSHFFNGPCAEAAPLEALVLDTHGEVLEPLGMDQTIKGKPMKLENLTDGDTVYRDASIYAVSNRDFVGYTDAKNTTYGNAHILRVTIADPSQLRTAMSYDSYDNLSHVRPHILAQSCNAVCGLNGDYFKNASERGYVFRQGVLYRSRAGGERDALIIDSQGDFHAVYRATNKSIEEAIAALPEGTQAVNVINFGPVLVDHGKVIDIASGTVGLQDNKQDQFEYTYRMPRIALVQLGHLQYAIVEIDAENTKGQTGMMLQTFAEYIHSLFPDCLMAYNLDGGNSTNLLFVHTGPDNYGRPSVQCGRVHSYPESRSLGDIIYFATLVD